MGEVRLSSDLGEISLPLVVVHMPRPKHARLVEDAPIYEQLVEEVLCGSSTQHFEGDT